MVKLDDWTALHGEPYAETASGHDTHNAIDVATGLKDVLKEVGLCGGPMGSGGPVAAWVPEDLTSTFKACGFRTQIRFRTPNHSRLVTTSIVEMGPRWSCSSSMYRKCSRSQCPSETEDTEVIRGSEVVRNPGYLDPCRNRLVSRRREPRIRDRRRN